MGNYSSKISPGRSSFLVFDDGTRGCERPLGETHHAEKAHWRRMRLRRVAGSARHCTTARAPREHPRAAHRRVSRRLAAEPSPHPARRDMATAASTVLGAGLSGLGFRCRRPARATAASRRGVPSCAVATEDDPLSSQERAEFDLLRHADTVRARRVTRRDLAVEVPPRRRASRSRRDPSGGRRRANTSAGSIPKSTATSSASSPGPSTSPPRPPRATPCGTTPTPSEDSSRGCTPPLATQTASASSARSCTNLARLARTTSKPCAS